MSDIRKRTGINGITYQVRYPDSLKKTRYSYATFNTMKEARAYLHDSSHWQSKHHSPINAVAQAVDQWLKICETEGTDGQEPVTIYTLRTYRRRAAIMKSYPWPKSIQALSTPDVVEFSSWLLQHYSKYVAHKTLSSFHTVLKEMALRGIMTSNVASGVS